MDHMWSRAGPALSEGRAGEEDIAADGPVEFHQLRRFARHPKRIALDLQVPLAGALRGPVPCQSQLELHPHWARLRAALQT